MKPTLLIMAAGMGSRYGGLKQLDHVDGAGHKIIDFSIYDAMKAGFGKVVFVIREEHLRDFKEAIGDRINAHIPVEYAFQSLDRVPEGTVIPEGREKPWGTAHAVYAARERIEGPFAVINADDFYGREAFQKMREYIENAGHYAMVGYKLRNTLTENGYVSRGVCRVNGDGFLMDVEERTHIEKDADRARYLENPEEASQDKDVEKWVPLTGDETVSMNFWGFQNSFFDELQAELGRFFDGLKTAQNPLKAECYLPNVVSALIADGKAGVKVLKTEDRWFGVTYKEDKESVVRSIAALKEKGIYPNSLWEQ